jgi:DNA repair protein RadC
LTIKCWPESEKPREKLFCSGASVLSEAELLAVVLSTGQRGRSAVAVARDLLLEFGDLSGVITAKIEKLQAISGMGPAKIANLKAIKEIGLRCDFIDLISKEALTNTDKAKDYLRARFCQHDIEVFSAIFLDTQHRVLAFEELFKGTIDGAAVYPREVVKRCIAHNAAAIILAHNHPSGVAEPSQADIAITAKLKQALAMIDIRVLDHLVIGANEVVSLSDRALV